jgi:membrane associated rhomboid family serine protease
MTWAFTGLCILVFALNRYFAAHIPFDFERLVYYPYQGGIVAAIGASFLHFGYVHLIGNVVYLFLFGRYVEDRMGAIFFSLAYLGCAGAGNVLQGLFNTHVLGDPYVGIIGASGAVSGLLGAFTVRFFLSKLQIAYWVFMPLQAYTRAGKVEMPVVVAVGLWFGLQLARGLIQVGGFGTQVAYVAHISGFLLGTVTAAWGGHFREGRVDAFLQRAARYMKRGESYAAQGEYIRYLDHRPDDPGAHAGLARAAVVTGDGDVARKSYRKACELLIEQRRRGDCEAIYQEAVRGFDDLCLTEDYQINLAFGLERNLKPKLAVRAYEIFAGRYPAHTESPLALLRAAGIYLNTFSAPQKADDLYHRLIDNYPDDVWVDFATEQRRKLACERA